MPPALTGFGVPHHGIQLLKRLLLEFRAAVPALDKLLLDHHVAPSPDKPGF